MASCQVSGDCREVSAQIGIKGGGDGCGCAVGADDVEPVGVGAAGRGARPVRHVHEQAPPPSLEPSPPSRRLAVRGERVGRRQALREASPRRRNSHGLPLARTGRPRTGEGIGDGRVSLASPASRGGSLPPAWTCALSRRPSSPSGCARPASRPTAASRSSAGCTAEAPRPWSSRSRRCRTCRARSPTRWPPRRRCARWRSTPIQEAADGTRKLRFRTSDGRAIESVLIPDENRVEPLDFRLRDRRSVAPPRERAGGWGPSGSDDDDDDDESEADSAPPACPAACCATS